MPNCYLSHPSFPSSCAQRLRARADVRVIALSDMPADASTRSDALSTLGAADTRWVTDSERFLAFSDRFSDERRRACDLLVDKSRFRALMNDAPAAMTAASVPVDIAALRAGLTWADARAPLGNPSAVVLKPVRGFQSDLVAICRDADDWARAVAQALSPPPGTSPVTDGARMIVERYVEGDEYAVDVYFDRGGAPVIAGIYLHPFRDARDARDIVYRTSPALMRAMRPRIETALAAWNSVLGLRDFPAHIELRATAGGAMFPIEFNPLRFGLLTMDIALHAFGVNAYDLYFDGERPDWAAIERTADVAEDTGLIVAPLICRQAATVEVDHAAFARDLMARGLRIHHLHRLPHTEIPFIAAVYAGGRAADMDLALHDDFSVYARDLDTMTP